MRSLIHKRGVLSVLVAMSALMLSVLSANAGTALFAGTFNRKGEFIPGPTGKKSCFSIRYSHCAMNTSNGVSSVTIDETIIGHVKAGTASVGILPLPVGVEKESVRLGAFADDVLTPLAVEFVPAREAGRVLRELVKATKRSEMLAYKDQPLLLVRRFTLASEQKVRLTYRQKTEVNQGLRVLTCPMPADHLALEKVARASVSLTLHDDSSLGVMFSPSHECEIERKGSRAATVTMTMDGAADGEDFRFAYVAAKDALGLRVLTHRPNKEEDGFFLLLGRPSGSIGADAEVAKDIIFVLDISGSMRGTKMGQAQAAIEHCLDNLQAGDRFNIVAFSTKVTKFRGDVVKRSDRNIKAAKVFVDELTPTGRTNIGDALSAGLAGKADAGRPRIMIFLTDGTPTAGERAPRKILDVVKNGNAAETQVFVMGMGHDVNAHLLDGISELTNGGSEYVAPEEEIDVKVAALFNRINCPFMDDVALDFGGLKVKSVFPQKVPSLFLGDEVMIAGRYSGGGKHTITIKGSLHGKDRAYTCTADFPVADEGGHDFIGPLWAARNIGFYLQEIRLHGEKKELIDEIVSLSHEYGIITEYTAFLADASSAGMSHKDVKEEAERRMSDANRVHSGKWAFNQARNDKALQQRTSIGKGANSFVDREGKVKDADNIRQIDGVAYYQRKGRWVEAEAPAAAAPRTIREVKLFSEEYFKLVEKNKKFSRAQALGGAVTVNLKDETIVVK